jgi:pimeloyl-ACP methyl ester carboxylesterase
MRILSALLLTVALALGAPSMAAAPAPIGIVLLHGKKGTPLYLAPTRAALISHGYLVSTPEMCWSDRRLYDRLYADCLSEIDAAVAELRQRGAKSIVIAGHSLGGAAAIAYGAGHDGLAGVAGIAAGDAFWGPAAALPDIARARALVTDGKGDTMGQFEDVRIVGQGRTRTTAAHFLSFVAPPAAQMMPATVAQLRVPLLLVAGTRDMITLQYGARAYTGVHDDTGNRFVQVDADHSGILSPALTPLLEWLAGLQR